MSKARNISLGLVVLVTILASSHHSSKLADTDTTKTPDREIAMVSAKPEKNQPESSQQEMNGLKKTSPRDKKMNPIKRAQR